MEALAKALMAAILQHVSASDQPVAYLKLTHILCHLYLNKTGKDNKKQYKWIIDMETGIQSINRSITRHPNLDTQLSYLS